MDNNLFSFRKKSVSSRYSAGNYICLVAVLSCITLAILNQLYTLPKLSIVSIETSALRKQASSGLTTKTIDNIASQITVQIRLVSSKDVYELVGSGTLVGQEQSIYTVATAAHVLNEDVSSYIIKTNDGKNHIAIDAIEFYPEKDLAFLRFRSSDIKYQIPKITSTSEFSVDETVYAAGFPLSKNRFHSSNFLAVRQGNISLILRAPLEDGYRLAYTSSVDVGMSGGPVINNSGTVIGINGMRNDSLWYEPSRYADGSYPTEQTQSVLSISSLAIVLDDVKITTISID